MTGPRKKLYIAKDSKNSTVFDFSMEYMFEKYEIHFNDIALDFEIRLKDDDDEWRC